MIPDTSLSPERTSPATAGGSLSPRHLLRRIETLAARFGAWIDRRLGLLEGTRESGQATVEFVIVFPIFMIVFLSAFEASLLLTRQLMLERSLDLVMRDIRLGNDLPPWQIRGLVCDNARILPNCGANMVIEMTSVSRTDYALPAANQPCVDRTISTQTFDVDSLIDLGSSNVMTLVRACFVVDPVFPGAGLGLEIVRGSGEIQMVSASAYVREP